MLPAANPRQIADQLPQQCRRSLLDRGRRAENGEQGVGMGRQRLRMPRTHMSLVQFNFNGLKAHEGNLTIP